MSEEECENLLNEDDLGPLGINYLYIYKCQLSGYEGFTILLFLGLTTFLIYLLGHTADTYFSPTLGSICEKLKIPYQVAGVTFLAMGNGSPDVFASITSFTGGQDALIGIGALLGASMFVVTVVVGIVIILSPCKVDSFVFLRDICFHIISVTLFTYSTIIKNITILIPGLFFILYTIYVSVVIISWWKMKDSNDFETNPSNFGVAGVQAAYWHASARQKLQSSNRSLYSDGKNNNNNNNNNRNRNLNSSINYNENSNNNSNNNGNKEFNYTFLILGEPKFTTKNGLPEYQEEDDEDEESGDGEVTINLSGGLITPHFDHELLEDYFNPSNSNIETKEEKSSSSLSSPNKSTKSTLMAFDGVETVNESESKSKQSTFSTPFFSSNSQKNKQKTSTSSTDGEELDAPLLGKRTRKQKSNMVLSQLYWNQVQLRRRMQHHFLNSDWWEYPIYMKLFTLLEYPLVFLRDITIPTVDPELWSKTYAVIQPIFSPLLIIYAMGNWNSKVSSIPTPLLGFLIGVPISFYVCLTTHNSKPPLSGLYSVIWVLMAFTLCVVWIYIFAGELVTCLQTIGIISGIPPPVLGLTILAWGNSVGDLFANMAVAKQGLGEMAIAGCYGGPVFNLCLGLGISFTYVSLASYPSSFLLSIDTSSVISLIYLYIALISTLCITLFNKFEMKSYLGYYLLILYCLYSITQLVHVLFF